MDEDVSAWGANPFGIDGLDGFSDVLQGVGLLAVLASVLAGVAAVLVRVITSRGGTRQQMRWFFLLMAPAVALIVADTDGLLPGALSAVIVFALMIGAIGYPLLGRQSASPGEG